MSSEVHRLWDRVASEAIPLEVSLELTRRCSLSCAHCYLQDEPTSEELPTARWLRLLEELADLGTLFLALTGGEPMLREGWHEIAQRARELGFAVRLQSNGTLIDGVEARRIAALGLTVELTMLSLDERTADRYTGVNGSAKIIRAAVEELRAHDVRVVLKTPILGPTADGVAEIHAYGKRIGAELRSSHLITVTRSGGPRPTALRMNRNQLVDHLRGELFDLDALRAATPIREDRPLCAAASSFCHITASGEVLACNLLPRSGGSIAEGPFREIWRSSPWLAEVRSIRRRHLKGCDSCADLNICGRCHALAMLEDGDIYGPSRSAGRFAAAIHLAEGNKGDC